MTDSIAIVIVHFGPVPVTVRAVESVIRAQMRSPSFSYELCVVNNDPSALGLRDNLPSDVVFIDSDEPRGYGAAINAGVGRLPYTDWILALNNDVELDDRIFDALLGFTRPDRTGSIVPLVEFADPDSGTGGGIINSTGLEVDATGASRDRNLGDEIKSSPPAGRVFGGSGCAVLYKSEAFREVGGFDESFFMYWEDVDLAWRLNRRGYASWFEPSARVRHLHSYAAGNASPLTHFHVGLNRVRTLAKNASSRQLLKGLPRALLLEFLHAVYVLIADRTFAGFLGRLRGFREWRMYRSCAPTGVAELQPPFRMFDGLRRRRRHSVQHSSRT